MCNTCGMTGYYSTKRPVRATAVCTHGKRKGRGPFFGMQEDVGVVVGLGVEAMKVERWRWRGWWSWPIQKTLFFSQDLKFYLSRKKGSDSGARMCGG